MRILLVNKFLHHVGGTESVFFSEWHLLSSAGHEVIPFGMAHPDNLDSPYQDYWVPTIDYTRPTPGQMRELIYSPIAAQQIGKLVEDTRPDIAHLHNIYHQLSPSILPVLLAAGVPVVMTVHDYKLICPNYRLFTHNKPCTRCVQSHPWHAVLHRCHHSSWPASMMVALETAQHRRQNAYARIDMWLTPSQFVRTMLVRGGYPAGNIQVVPHALGPAPEPEPIPLSLPDGKFVLFAGRLEPEKGLRVLWEVAKRMPNMPFVWAGTGSLSNQLPSLDNVTLLGKLTAGQLETVRQQAAMEIMPSLWYEVFGMSALEALRAGVPLIVTESGALPEIIQHEETGLLVPPGNVTALAAAIRRLWQDEWLAYRLGQAGPALVQAHYRPEQHLSALMDIYSSIISHKEQQPA